jgi:hypothetical protein
MTPVKNRVRYQVDTQVWDQIKNNASYQVKNQALDRVEIQVTDQVWRVNSIVKSGVK